MPAQSGAPFDIPAFSAFARPGEEVRKASEKMLSLWAGAFSPLWVPFFAAASFGIGTWALMQALQRQQELLKDMPVNGLWQATERMSEALLGTVDTTPVAAAKAASKAMDVMSKSEAAVIEATTNVMNQTIGLATKTIESATQAAAKEVSTVSKLSSPEPARDASPVVPIPTLAPKPASRRRPARKA
jgi:hypothetical protein